MGLLGAHVSIAGGVEKAVGRGADLECEAIQIFSKNQRQWQAPPLSDESVKMFRDALDQTKIEKVIIHDSYLINLAAPDEVAWEKSVSAFTDELYRADRLGVHYLVFHPGSHMKSGEDVGLRRIAEGINKSLDALSETKAELLLETTAGQGQHLGYRFEQLSKIISAVHRKERMGVCFDTAHAFSSGYDISTPEGLNEVIDKIENVLGKNKLKIIHLNDSKGPLGSGIDHHEHIGKGYIGLECFRELMQNPRFKKYPMILETPKDDKFGDINNLELLRELRSSR